VQCSIAINISAQVNRTTVNNTSPQDQEEVFYHPIERGQTLYSIAKMYDVKVNDILRLNLGSDEGIRAGDRLRIPQKKIITDSYIYHTIRAGETLYGLSRRYDVNATGILDANPGLSQTSFSTGKTIRIPLNRKQKDVEFQTDANEIHYTVPPKETIYNICKTFKTTEEELLDLNPELSGGLRAGITLRIPRRIDEWELPQEREPNVREINAMLNANRTIKHVNTVKVVVLLPYNAETNAPNQARIEYYEGMLLAVDSLRNMGYATEMFIYDTGDDPSILQNILRTEGNTLKNANLIIGGVTNEQIKLIADFAADNQIKYVIPFTSKNDEVLNNAYIFQVNTPHNYLYANASYAGANLFAKHNIIFLDTKEDHDEQTDFIREFKHELRYRNIAYSDLIYEAKNFPTAIKKQLSNSKPNVIIPLSSSLDALIKIKTALRMIAEKQPEYALSLFGYPVWQTYSTECLDDFHALDTYIYSLFYADNMNPKVKAFYENYKNWYSKSPASTLYPKYSMLGFDTGMYFFGALQIYGANFENNLSEINYKSLQTGFNFERVNNWGGFINTNIYIVHYNKDFTITRSDFR
jgi:LysM repeat protein